MIWHRKLRVGARAFVLFESKVFLGLALIVAALFCSPAVSAQENGSGSHSGEPRVKPIPVEEMNARQKEVLGIVDGEPLPIRAKMNLFRTLIHNPDLMAKYFPLGDVVSFGPEIPAKHRELVIMRLAWLYQGEYEWGQHYRVALSAGWTDEDIERIKLGPDATGWNEFDRILLKAADQLMQNAYLDDEVWAALGEQYSVQDIMVLITLVTHHHWAAMMTNTLGIQLEDGAQGFQR